MAPRPPAHQWDVAAPSLDDFAALAQAAFEGLPAPIKAMCGNVTLRVDDWPSDEVLEETGTADPYDLTGLYQGEDLTLHSVEHPNTEGNRVYLYRRPILDEWCARGDESLAHLIAHVLVHEIGHHFGLSDEDMHALEEADG